MKMLTTSAGVRLLSPAAVRQATITASRAPTTASAILVSSRRQYATTQETSKRRSVTPFNDNGHVPWTRLSAGEKAGRAVQQTFNFGLVILGVVLTVRFPSLCISSLPLMLSTDSATGRNSLPPLHRRDLARVQNRLLQPGRRPDPCRPSLRRPSFARQPEGNCRSRRRDVQQVAPSAADRGNGREGQQGSGAFEDAL